MRLLAGILAAVIAASVSCSRVIKFEKRVEFSAAELYQGYRAENVRISPEGDIVLDERKIWTETRGEIETDVIDLLDPACNTLAPAARSVSFELTCWGSAPQGGTLELYTRTGDFYFSRELWSGWRKAEGLAVELPAGAGRYLQARIVLAADSPENSPRLNGLDVTAKYSIAVAIAENPLQADSIANPKIVTSPVEFGYEKSDQPPITPPL